MSIDKIVIIARHEYGTNVRRVGFIVVTLLFPALGALAIVIVGFFSGEATTFLRSQFVPPSKKIAIIDQSQLFATIPPQYADRFTAMQDEEAGQRALLADQINSYAVIPRDYLESGKVMLYAKGLFGSSTPDSSALREFLVNGLLAGRVDAEYVTRAGRPANLTLVTLDSRGNPSAAPAFSFIAGFVAPYAFSILLFVAVFASSGYLLRSVSEEKESRVIEVILSSVSATELLAGKVIGLGALGLTQVAVWLLSSFVLTGGLGVLIAGATLVLNPGSFGLAVLYFLLGYILFGTIMAAAGSLGTSVRESQQLAGIFSFAASTPWFLAGVAFANPNAPIIRALCFFPLTAPTMMMLRLPIGEVPTVDIIGSLMVLLVSLPIVLWAGAKIFRSGLLMYGKRLALREIVGALRNA